MKNEGTMSLTEAYSRGAILVLAAVGSVFAYQFLHDVYRYLVHGKTGAGS
jgi:hypothetical protein